MLPLDAHLERMLTINLGEVVVHLECGADFVGGQECVAAQSLKPLNSERGQSTIFLELRDALDAKVRRKAIASGTFQVIGLGRNTSGVKITQSSPCLVHGRWRKRVGVAESALFGESGLGALLKAAAIRYSSKEARDELGIVNHAGTKEHCVLIVRIQVDLCIKGSAVFYQYWRGREVRRNSPTGRRGIELQEGDGILIEPQWVDHVEARAGR